MIATHNRYGRSSARENTKAAISIDHMPSSAVSSSGRVICGSAEAAADAVNSGTSGAPASVMSVSAPSSAIIVWRNRGC